MQLAPQRRGDTLPGCQVIVGSLPTTHVALCVNTNFRGPQRASVAADEPGCGGRDPGTGNADVTHGAVDPQGEQHDEENHSPGGGQWKRGQRLGVDDEN